MVWMARRPEHCDHCGEPLPPSVDEAAAARARRVGDVVQAQGRPRRFCGTRCRNRAMRRRAAGLPESAFTAGAARGELEAAGKSARLRAAAKEFRSALEEAGGPSVYLKRGLESV